MTAQNAPKRNPQAYLQARYPNAYFHPTSSHGFLMTTSATAAMEQQLLQQHPNPLLPNTQGSSVSQKAQQSPNFNTQSFSQNASVETPPAQSPPPAQSSGQNAFARFSASTQEILKRLDASHAHAINAGSARWEAARESVMKSMAKTSSIPTAPSGTALPNTKAEKKQCAGENTPQNNGETVTLNTASATSPERRGPGRPRGRGGGRPRGSGRARGKGRGGKRKREGSEDEDASLSENSESYSPAFTVTKSGRNVQKPSQFNPAPSPVSPSTSGGAQKGRRPYRRGPEFALCNKCGRGHSPTSNAIVFCDGCNTPYHQWCHDPHISSGVVEVETASWFCTRCRSKREMEDCPLDKRVGLKDLNLNPEEILNYFSSLSTTTLAKLLQHATSTRPDLPAFAPNTRAILENLSEDCPPGRSRSSTTKPILNGHFASKDNNINNEINAQAGHEADPSDSYADFDNAAGDPPATYPRPGNGPIKPTPTTNLDDMHWLFDDSFTTFNHYCNADSARSQVADGHDINAEVLPDVNLVAIHGDDNGGWIQKSQQGFTATSVESGRLP